MAQTTIPGINPCATAQLHITLGETDGAAGNQYTPIVFTNGGPSTCTLDGHPGVSFVDAAGNQVGDSAHRNAGATPTVTLQVGAQAHATIDYHDPGFFDDCAPAPTVSVKIYPPDQTEAIALPFPSSLCTKPTSEPELTIDTVRAGPTLAAGEPG
ncbi:MAG: DUF4232 domain-containing protein [Ilumatobacteraceae bacterium]